MPRLKKMSEKCVYVGCTEVAHAVDLCVGHHKQYQRGQQLRPLLPRNPNRENLESLCEYESCESIAKIKKMCRKHYMMIRRAVSRKVKDAS